MSKKIKIGDCFEGDNMGDALVCYRITSELWPVVAYGQDDFIMLNPKVFSPIPTLHLPIGNDPKKYGGCWFDLIRSGVKKEEYRDVKDSYCRRFLIGKRELEFQSWEEMMGDMRNFTKNPRHESMAELFEYFDISFKDFKVLHLTNGYSYERPQLWAHIESITIGRGNPEWGAPVDRDVFIIKLGAVFHTKNLKP